MSDTEGALSYRQAAEVIREAAAYEAPLRRRTEGVTWMLWGLVCSGLVSSGSSLAWTFPYPHPVLDWYWPLWVLAGIVGTKALWGIAGLALPRRDASPRRSLLAFAAAFVAVYLAFAGLAVSLPESALPPLGLAVFAMPWLLLGLTDLARTTPVGRKVLVAIGGSMLVVALATAPLYAPDVVDPNWYLMSNVIMATTAAIPFTLGAWQALRG